MKLITYFLEGSAATDLRIGASFNPSSRWMGNFAKVISLSNPCVSFTPHDSDLVATDYCQLHFLRLHGDFLNSVTVSSLISHCAKCVNEFGSKTLSNISTDLC